MGRRPSAQAMLSTATSIAGSVMLIRTIADALLPRHLRGPLISSLRSIFRRFSSDFTFIIREFNGPSTDKLYAAAETYLVSKISPSTTRRLCVSRDDKNKEFTISMEIGETVVDVFEGVKLRWLFVHHEYQNNPKHGGPRAFYLTFHKKHKDKVLKSYLPHVLTQAKAMADDRKTLKLHTLDYDAMCNMRMIGNKGIPWSSVSLDHPATFSTVAMDAKVKEELMDDLQRFLKRKEFYRRVGKAWKRGYLLYGPPGTGKSSLIAAMANFLRFDVYDLELTDVSRNSNLRRILTAIANRSILVIEDVDRAVDFNDRNPDQSKGAALDLGVRLHRSENKMTLSGLLNFIDGLWSSSGEERVIIFTTNNKDKLDPALLRPGRMDVHIHMSYCTFFGFKTLAKNYHSMEEDHDHPSFQEIKQLMMEVKVTPAQVAEELTKSDDPNEAFEGLIEFLKRKKVGDEKEETKSEQEVEKHKIQNALIDLSTSAAKSQKINV